MCLQTEKAIGFLQRILFYLIFSTFGDIGLQRQVVHRGLESVLGTLQLCHGNISESIGEDGDEGETKISSDSSETLPEVHCLQNCKFRSENYLDEYSIEK